MRLGFSLVVVIVSAVQSIISWQPQAASFPDSVREVPMAQSTRVIRFAGHKWSVKNGLNLPPRNNNWSDDPRSVWIDVDGKLHLKIRQQEGVWYSAQVTAFDYASHGSYHFYVETPVADLGDSAVLGLFLYADDQNEIDIEFRQRENERFDNGSYVIQPYIQDGHRETFQLDWEGQTVHEIVWQPDFVNFRSLRGDDPDSGQLLYEWRFDQGRSIPPENRNLRVQMNLWMLNAATHADEIEVVIADVVTP
jgi:hypothetical protein